MTRPNACQKSIMHDFHIAHKKLCLLDLIENPQEELRNFKTWRIMCEHFCHAKVKGMHDSILESIRVEFMNDEDDPFVIGLLPYLRFAYYTLQKRFPNNRNKAEYLENWDKAFPF